MRHGRRSPHRAIATCPGKHRSQKPTAQRHRRRTRPACGRHRRSQHARHEPSRNRRHGRRQTRPTQIRPAAHHRRRTRRTPRGIPTRPHRRNRTRIPSGKRPTTAAGTRPHRSARHDLRSAPQRHRRRGLPMHQIRQRRPAARRTRGRTHQRGNTPSSPTYSPNTDTTTT